MKDSSPIINYSRFMDAICAYSSSSASSRDEVDVVDVPNVPECSLPPPPDIFMSSSKFLS